jgi:hypothetical protein
LNTVELVTQHNRTWQPPAEYLQPGVANAAVRVLLGGRTGVGRDVSHTSDSGGKILRATTH